MANPTGADHPRTPSATTTVRALQPRASSSTGAKSKTASRASSRATSLRPSELAPDNDAHTSARNSISPLPDPVKRERSVDEGGGAGLSLSVSLHDEEDRPPLPKRRRLDTDSVEDLLADDSQASSSLLPGTAESANPTSEARSHTDEPSAHVAQASDPHGAAATDVDSVLEEARPGLTSSPSQTSAGPSQTHAPSYPSTSISRPSGSEPPAKPPAESLASYNCPICFSPPRYATLTPCGHICCGECLFTAVKATIERSQFHGPASQNAKCPVCRAPIPGWDGAGGGVIGLKPRFLYDIGDNSSRKAG